MSYKIIEENSFKYYEKGDGDVLILLHGLFGALSNFYKVIDHFSGKMKVSIPLLPLYDLSAEETTLKGMVDYVAEFINYKGYDSVNLLGNSLGGHIALLYCLENQDRVKSLILTGSSGLFENSLGDTYPKKSDYEYIKEKTAFTFYDPDIASKELVDEVYEIVNNREKAIKILYLAKSALRNNMKEFLPSIKVPVLLLWGKEDRITPPFVAEEFNHLLPNSELKLISKCGHAAMMEKAEEFNLTLDSFLNKLTLTKA